MPKGARQDLQNTPDLNLDDAYQLISRRGDVRDRLFEEQVNRCAYCERPVSRKLNHAKIDHFHPRHGDLPWTQDCKAASGAADHDSSSVSWVNLLIVCKGGEGAAVKTCDSSKSNTDICAKLTNPKRRDLMAPTLVNVDRRGWLVARVGGEAAQGVIDHVLNLNTPRLVEQRLEVLMALRRRRAKVKGPGVSLKPAELKRKLEEKAAESELGSVYLSVAASL